MKKRLLSLFLLFVLLVSAMPLGVLSLLSFAAEEELSEKDYNDLYVKEGLVFSADFFKLNEHWSPDGHSYVIPTGPSDNKAYYDATTDKTFDFTVDNNRYAYTVTKTLNGATTTVGDYLGEAEANAAVAELAAADTEGATYAAVKGTATNMAWQRCVSAWLSADKALFANFTNQATPGGGKTPYLASCDNGFATTTSANRLHYVRTAAASLDNGYITLLPYGKSYTGGGGLQVLYTPEYVGTLETVTVLGGDLNTSAGGYVLFNNLALIPEKNATDGTYTIKGAPTDRAVKLGTITSAKPFPYQEITSLTYTMADGELAMYNGTETVLEAPYTGTTSAAHYFGWAGRSYSTEIYAMRYYSDVLSAYERAQNHFADIAKFFRLDVGKFAFKRDTYSAEALEAFYAAFEELDFTATRSEAQAVADAAFAVLDVAVNYPAISAEAYDSLYVKDELLYQIDFFPLNPYWDDAEDYGTIATGDTYLVTEANVRKWMMQFVRTAASDPSLKIYLGKQAVDADENAVPEAHIPFHIENGYVQFKDVSETVQEPPYLQLYFPQSYTPGETGYTMESLLSYDEVAPGAQSHAWLPWGFNLAPKLSILSSTSFKIMSSGVWSANYTLASQPTFEHGGKPFTLTYKGTTGEASSAAEILANGSSLTTATYDKADGGTTCCIGYFRGSYGVKLYALRFYDRALLPEEMAQNHFADMAKYFRLDVARMMEIAPFCKAADLAAFYAAFADLDFTATREEAQAIADTATAALSGTVSITEHDEDFYNSLYVQYDLMFALDFFPLNERWGRAEEFGTITAADSSSATKSAVTAWLNQFVVANPAGVSILNQGTAGDTGATDFNHQIPFFIKNGYIQYKSFSDGYTVNNNNPYLQFKPKSTDAYNQGGFTWEMQLSFDELTKSGTVSLPALSDLRPSATVSTGAFTVAGASGFTVTDQGTLAHGGKAFDFTYRLNATESGYDTVLSAGGTTLGRFTKTTAFGGSVCDIGWNFNQSGAKIYAVRLYDRSLSDKELQQNHFADLAKCFRLGLDGFTSFTAAERQRIYEAFAGYDLRTASYLTLQKAYNDLTLEMALEKYRAQYLEGDAFAAHNAFIDACIEKLRAGEGSLLVLDAIYSIPLSERAEIYALRGEALTQKAIDDAAAAYWAFDAEKYHSYDALYYDAGDLVAAYDFFALNAYWNADRAAGYLPTSDLLSSWESRTPDGGRYFDRFAVKGALTLRHEGVMAPFVIPTGEARGLGGFVLLGMGNRAADAFSLSGLGNTVSAEAVLRVDSATDKLFSVSGLTFGYLDGVYTAPGGMHSLIASSGIGAAAPVLGTTAAYGFAVTNAGIGKNATVALSVNRAAAMSAVGTAMADPSGTASLGLDQSFVGAVYALRYYRTELSDSQRAQNHFADMAKFYRLDLADIDLIRTSSAAAAELYAAFADFDFDDDRETLQATYDSFRADFLAAHSGLSELVTEVSSVVTLEGYQVRIAGTDGPAPNAYAGMRAVFTVDADLLAALEGRGYTVSIDVLTRNAQRGNSSCGRIVAVPVYDGSRYVAKSQTIDEIGECFVVTVLYASGEEGHKLPLADERIRELMTLEVAYDYAVTVERDGIAYSFTYHTTSDRFGETVNAKELYRYFGEEGDGELQGSEREDTLVKKMLSLIPPEESAIAAPTVGRLTLALDGEAYYTVTLPEGASDADRAAAEAFRASLSALTGAEFALVGEAGLCRDREIVLALGSQRADAAEFAANAAARALSYAIGTSGERVLVYAKDAAALNDALAVLLASVTDNKVGDALGENADSFYLPASLSVERLGGTAVNASALTLVLSARMDAERRAIVDGYLAAFRERTGITIAVATDDTTVGGYRILLGTSAGNSKAASLLAERSYTGYAIAPAWDDILVSAYTDVALRAALATLFATATDDGVFMLDTLVTCDFGAGQGVPHFVTEGRLDGGELYDAGNGSYTVSHTLVTEAEYLAYPALLEAAGFVRIGENERNGCLFATYAGEGADVILAYYPMLGQVKITVQPKGYLLPTGEAESYEKNPAVTPSVTLMDHELASYVMQLEDGSFLIVDGGDLNRAGAMDKMWDHLTSLTPAGEKPRIALWMLTHGHSDHVILATHFLEKYHNDLVLDAVAFNFPNYEVVDMPSEYAAYGDAIARDAERLVAALDRYYPDVTKWIPRTGQVHSLAGAEIEVLLSHEDYYPSNFHWGNDTSSAFRITLGGTSIVYLGDCTDALCRRIASTFGETLESDILQVSHHGVGGGDLGLYQLIDPKVCLFGTSVGEFTGDRCNGTGNYTSYNYNAWVRTTDWTRTVNGVEVTGARAHYHGSVRTTLTLPLE